MDEFPDSPRAEEPLLEHAVDVEGLQPRRSLNRSRSGTPGHRVLTIRSHSQQPNTGGAGTTPGAAFGSLPRQQSTMSSTPEASASGGAGGGGGGAGGGAEDHSPVYALAVRNTDGTNWKNDGVHELEVEILTEAVADAVADAVGEVVQEAVQEAVQTAMEDARFDFKANLYTLVAVTAAVLLERGIWNTWDMAFFSSNFYTSLLLFVRP